MTTIPPPNSVLNTTYTLSLFIKQARAEVFSCIQCKKVPLKSMNNEDGEILCPNCSLSCEGTIQHSQTVQKMIGNLMIKCVNSLFFENNPKLNITNNLHSIETAVNIIANPNCDWIGKVKDWEMHNQSDCQITIINCEYCKDYQCIRSLLSSHLSNDCPQIIVDCHLNCGKTMPRAILENHIQFECSETILLCTNDNCNGNIKRTLFEIHVRDECEYRMIYCPFVKYGCKVNDLGNIQYLNLEQHLIDYKIEHLSLQVVFCTAENAELLLKLQETEMKLHQKCEENELLQSVNERLLKEKKNRNEMKDSATPLSYEMSLTDILNDPWPANTNTLEGSKSKSFWFSCPICEETKFQNYNDIIWNVFKFENCECQVCRTCVKRYFLAILQSNTNQWPIVCPVCSTITHENDIQSFEDVQVMYNEYNKRHMSMSHHTKTAEYTHNNYKCSKCKKLSNKSLWKKSEMGENYIQCPNAKCTFIMCEKCPLISWEIHQYLDCEKAQKIINDGKHYAFCDSCQQFIGNLSDNKNGEYRDIIQCPTKKCKQYVCFYCMSTCNSVSLINKHQCGRLKKQFQKIKKKNRFF